MTWFSKELFSAALLKRRRTLLLAGLFGIAILLLGIVVRSSSAPRRVSEKPSPVSLVTPETLISDEEIWVDRLSKDQEATRAQLTAVEKQNQALEDQNKLLANRLEMMDAVLKGLGPTASLDQTGEDPAALPSGAMFPPQDGAPSQKKQSFPVSESTALPPGPTGPRLIHLSRGERPRALPKTVESYVPAGTHVPAILTSGVVANTSTRAPGDPMPIMLRLVGPGTLPRGFRADLKEAVLIGSCYGDLSSERATCRLHKMTVTERNGEILETPVEGWILGEDGRPGIKGEVVDRAGKVAREALTAGILSGMAGFFKQQTTSSYSPATLLKSEQSLTSQDVLKGGAANGAGSALEKLADFSIARAEQMQPVIVVASGRRVDVVFKEGVTLLETATRQELKLAGQAERLKSAQDAARQAPVQGVKGF